MASALRHRALTLATAASLALAAQLTTATAATSGADGLAAQSRDRWLQPERAAAAQILAQAAEEPQQLLEIQRRLGELGYEPGPADGRLGPRTRAAIRAFQEQQGLRADGEPSAELRARLEEAVAGQPRAAGAAVEARAAAAVTDPGRLPRFRAEVDRINARVRRAVGLDAFATVAERGGGAVELTATRAWRAAPEPARRANLAALSRIWGSMHGPDVPIVVRVVDEWGEVLMEARHGGGS